MITATLAALLLATPSETTRTFQIDNLERKAIVCAPTVSSTHPPLVFVFHGHGGNMNYSLRKFGVEKLWPEAVVVYPDGMPIKGMYDPNGTKNGWQKNRGESGDRDLHFFDTMLAAMKKDYGVDPNRVYSMGHSNGAAFTYLLWKERGDKLAAIGPAAAVMMRATPGLKPLPVFIVAGDHDNVVPFRWQQQTIQFLKGYLGVASGTPDWVSGKQMLYQGAKANLGVCVFPGGHNYPDEASKMIVDFFKAHTKR